MKSSSVLFASIYRLTLFFSLGFSLSPMGADVTCKSYYIQGNLVALPFPMSFNQQDYSSSTANIISNTGTYSQVVLWSGVEPNVGVVCANLPCLRPLFRPFARALSAVSSSTNASRMRRAKGKNANNGGEFVRLRHIDGSKDNNTATSTRDEAYGVRVETEGTGWEDEAGMIPMGKVHIRKGVDVRDV